MADLLMQQDPGIERKKRLAEAMIGRGQNYGPVQHWAQGLDRIASSLTGAYLGKQADTAEKAQRQEKLDKLSQVIANAGGDFDALASGLSSISPELALTAKIRGMEIRNQPPPKQPNSIEEFEYFQTLSPEQQEAWIRNRTNPGSTTPYFTPLQTSTGIYRFNARTGEIEPLMGQGGEGQGGQSGGAPAPGGAPSGQGRPLLPPAIDPTVQRAVAGAKAGGQIEGKHQAQSQADLSKTLSNAEQMISVINKAIEHPGRSTATGLSGTLDPRNLIPGTDARDFRVVMDQLGGKTFLQAFETLKGGGQITEIEGQKASDAIARLNTAQSDEEFLGALQELKGIVESGMDRARQAAGVATQPQAPSGITTPTTEEEYNALPSGALFIDPDDGKTYRKP